MTRFFPMDPEARKRQKQKIKQRLGIVFLLMLVVVVAVAYICIRWSGEWLVKDQPQEHYRWALILEGQTPDMERTDFAVQMLAEAKVDSVIVMGRRVFRDRNNVDFYLDDMQGQGNLDLSRVYLFRHDDNSSLEEAYSVIPALKQKGIDTVLLVTRGVATKRVNQIFNKLAGGAPVFVTVNLEDGHFHPATWIHTREARKIWFKEWTSFLVSQVELLGADLAEPIPGKSYPLQLASPLSKGKDNGEHLEPIANLLSAQAQSSSSVSVVSSSSAKAKDAVPEFSEEKKAEKKPEAKAETKVVAKPESKAKDVKTPAKSEKKSDKPATAKADKKSAVKSDNKADKKTDKKSDKKSDKKTDSKGK